MKKESENRKKVNFGKAKRIESTAFEGLTSEQVEERKENGFVNFNSAVKTKSVTRIVVGHLMTVFNFVNIAIAIALICVGSYKNTLYMAVIISNILIGIIQEIRAKRAVDKLSFISRGMTKAVRDGKEVEINSEDIVLDDIIIYKSGEQVSVDCVLVDGECESNESFVTGESDAVFKKTGDTLLAGSFVSSGECRARADKIADQSYISSISKSAKIVKGSKSILMTSLKRIITVLSIVIFPLGAFLFMDQYAISNSISDAIVSTSASLLGMIPQGLMLLTSSALALSVVKLSRKNVLVKDLYSVEMLARVDVVCLDKTGTLTEGKLNVEKTVALDTSVNCDKLLAGLAKNLGSDNATMEAIASRFNQNTDLICTKKVPFSSKTKWSGCVFNGIGSVVIGAAEYILPGNANVLNEVKKYADDYRVLLLCTSAGEMSYGTLPTGLKPAALVLLQDKVRSTAPTLIKYLTSQDVGIRIISGDNPVTVSAIAKVCGVPDAEKYIDCSTLKTEKDIKKAAKEYIVFGRVTPFQKKQLVKALKKQKHTVAMTGDGVNDILAMKESDCSIAMGGGTDAARNIATLVLMESNFDTLPHVINEGRRSVNNIQRSASFFLTKTIYATLLAFCFLLLHKTYPFVPIQQSLISTACIGIPSVILALEPNHNRIKGSFLGNVFMRALPGGVSVTLGVVAVSCWNDIAEFVQWSAACVDVSFISTMVLYVTGFVSYLVLIHICWKPNYLGKILMVVVAGLFVGGIIGFGGLLEVAHLDFKAIAVTAVICGLCGCVMYWLAKLSRILLGDGRKQKIVPAESENNE